MIIGRLVIIQHECSIEIFAGGASAKPLASEKWLLQSSTLIEQPVIMRSKAAGLNVAETSASKSFGTNLKNPRLTSGSMADPRSKDAPGRTSKAVLSVDVDLGLDGACNIPNHRMGYFCP